MLNRPRLLHKLQLITGRLFADFSDEFIIAEQSWQHIVEDATFIYKVKAAQTTLPLPTWNEDINKRTSLKNPLKTYQVIAIDGSQVYPDRHQGTSCFLINIGTVLLNYGLNVKNVELESTPYVFLGDEDSAIERISPDYINLRREELEFCAAGPLAKQKRLKDAPLLILLDGSLIFWHLEGKAPEMRTQFLARYISALYELYEERIINASYISLPRSKELVNLLKFELSEGNLEDTSAYNSISHMLDVHIVNTYLKPGERSTIFKHNSKITPYYPEMLQPHFFYMHTGLEIVRIELPAWIARDKSITDIVAHIIYDQSCKGHGYPVALAEAHEQAVVKGADREFFYHLINKLAINLKQRPQLSQKVVKKRGLGI